MGGQGFYDHYSAIQRNAVFAQVERLRRAVQELDLSRPEFRVIDYGCGPGRNSMAALHAVLDEIRTLSPDMPVVTVHNDQIGNDWNDLFSNINGPEGYLQDIDHVRPDDPSGLAAGGHRLYRAFWRIAEKMAEEDLIDSKSLEMFVFPLYFREVEEIRAPLESEPDLKAAFEIVELVNELVPNPYAQLLKENSDKADVDLLAETFFDRFEQLFVDEPDKYIFDNHSMTLVLRRH